MRRCISTTTPSSTRPGDDDWESSYELGPQPDLRVNNRWLDTGLRAMSGRRILRLQSRPMGFRADIDVRLYAEEQDSE